MLFVPSIFLPLAWPDLSGNFPSLEPRSAQECLLWSIFLPLAWPDLSGNFPSLEPRSAQECLLWMIAFPSNIQAEQIIYSVELFRIQFTLDIILQYHTPMEEYNLVRFSCSCYFLLL